MTEKSDLNLPSASLPNGAPSPLVFHVPNTSVPRFRPWDGPKARKHANRRLAFATLLLLSSRDSFFATFLRWHLEREGSKVKVTATLCLRLGARLTPQTGHFRACASRITPYSSWITMSARPLLPSKIQSVCVLQPTSLSCDQASSGSSLAPTRVQGVFTLFHQPPHKGNPPSFRAEPSPKEGKVLFSSKTKHMN